MHADKNILQKREPFECSYLAELACICVPSQAHLLQLSGPLAVPFFVK